ncbi:MAG TPA: hypothetical protein DCP91_13440 [Eggerthellaceae bacterium]|nr:hypothetical protein [Eggerthellaceae bacterium]
MRHTSRAFYQEAAAQQAGICQAAPQLSIVGCIAGIHPSVTQQLAGCRKRIEQAISAAPQAV